VYINSNGTPSLGDSGARQEIPNTSVAIPRTGHPKPLLFGLSGLLAPGERTPAVFNLFQEGQHRRGSPRIAEEAVGLAQTASGKLHLSE